MVFPISAKTDCYSSSCTNVWEEDFYFVFEKLLKINYVFVAIYVWMIGCLVGCPLVRTLSEQKKEAFVVEWMSQR